MQVKGDNSLEQTFLKVENVSKFFELKTNRLWGKKVTICAVKSVSFEVQKGITYGLVGESGSGKSTICQMLVGLLRPDEGRILYKGRDINVMTKKERQKMQLVFQDPYSSLNPRLTIGYSLKEALLHGGVPKGLLKEKALEFLRKVGLKEEHYYRYPHQLSGGQRQRVAIARALCMSPDFLVLDEPVSALDVLIQAQILELLMELKTQYELTYLIVSHDLKLVAYLSDTIGVMYRGQIVEQGPALDIYYNPKHRYTKQLVNSVPPSPCKHMECINSHL